MVDLHLHYLDVVVYEFTWQLAINPKNLLRVLFDSSL